MTHNQDPIYRRLEELREFHVYPSYQNTFDEVWGYDPICSCGIYECDISKLIALLPSASVDNISDV